MVIVVAGDRAAIEEPLRRLGLGEVTVLPNADESRLQSTGSRDSQRRGW
jgi:hypothetical protein